MAGSTARRDDEAFFVRLKKEQVKWEEDAVKLIEAKIKGKQFEEALNEIEDSRKWLSGCLKQAETRFKNHNDFVRGDPRGDSVRVCELLKIKKGSDAFKASHESNYR